MGVASFSRVTALRPLLTPASRRSVSTATSSSQPQSRKERFNHPTTILYGWAALIVIAGFGYYTVKSNNTAKKKSFMIKQGQAQQVELQNGQVGEDQGTAMPTLMSSSNQEKHAQSPLQSLFGAFNRQTTQRSRSRSDKATEQDS